MVSLIKNESRQHPRQRASREIEAKLTIGGEPFAANIIDYSFSGISLRVGKAIAHRAGRDKYDLQVAIQDTTYAGTIKHTYNDGQFVVLGINLTTSSEALRESFTLDDSGWDLIEDPEAVQNLFNDLVFKGPEVPIEARQVHGGFGTLIASELKNEIHLVAEIFSTQKGSFEVGRVRLRFELFQTCHAFDATILSVSTIQNKNVVEIELPKKVARLLRRETFRVSNGENGIKLGIKLQSSLLGTSPSSIELLDFSEHGFSVLDPTGWASGPKGFFFDNVEITTPEKIRIVGKGFVRSHRWIALLNRHSVGIEFVTETDADRDMWHNVVLRGRYPQLSFDYKNSDCNEIWDLFERSNYLHLKGKEAYADVIDLTQSTWRSLSNAGTQWSKRALIRSNTQIVGHIQMDRIYPETWCIHHLAIDPTISKMIAKELYAVTTDVLQAEGGKYLINFTEASKPWNQRSYYDFVAKYRYSDHNEMKSFQIYEVDTHSVSSDRKDPNTLIRLANIYDLKRILRFFEVNATPLEREALGLTQEHLNLDWLNRQIGEFGLERSREFIVAMKGAKLLGFAQLETGSAGVNIVGILDMLYLHIAKDLQPDSTETVIQELIWASMKRYAEKGRKKFILALETDNVSKLVGSHIRFVTTAIRWIAKRDILPRYHAYSQLLYGHLTLRKEKIRGRKPS